MIHIRYLQELIEREGGYADHPADRGGPTKYGITEAVARDYGWKGDMRDLPLELAEDIYIQRYWLEPRFNDVVKLSPALAEEMLDTGVNMGTQWPGRFLQRALNVLNLDGKVFPDLEVDGRIGTRTLAALKRYLDHRSVTKGTPVLLRLMDAQQSVRYMEISEKNKSQEVFTFGWIDKRIDNVEY